MRASKDYVPDDGEYERLLDASRDAKDRLILHVLAESGMRCNEFIHLRPYWMDDGMVRIPLGDPETGFRAKTKAAARAIPLRDMDRGAWNILQDWMKDWGEAGMCHGTVWLRVRNAGRRAELRLPIFPHALRAYCATKWAGRIQNPFTLMELMGWETPGVAMRYIRTTGKRAQRAVKAWRSQNG